MELKFHPKPINFLKNMMQEVQNSEQTQELKLSDSMPDIGRVIGAWGQPIVRSKEWRSEEICFSGGMMVWVLYLPEGEGQPQTVSSWVPFHMRWDIPATRQEGSIRISCLNRFVDARSVSPRKLMLRCGMGVLAEAYLPDTAEVLNTPGEEKGIELLRKEWRKKLYKLAAEKTFHLDEELRFPDEASTPAGILSASLYPKLQESRVLSDKLVFRGNGLLHLLYQNKDGQFCSKDFEIPFSQYTELGCDFSGEAAVDIRFGVTNLEPELTENGGLRLKAGMVAQYLIWDLERIEYVEDAYALDSELELQEDTLVFPVAEGRARDVFEAEHSLQTEGQKTVDAWLLPDFPQVQKNGEESQIRCAGTVCLLCAGDDGSLQTVSSRWEDTRKLQGDPDADTVVYPQISGLQVLHGNGNALIKTQQAVECLPTVGNKLRMITQLRTGKKREKEKNRPSLILQRSVGESLWEIARKNMTTVAAIREANQLEGDPQPGQILLIPVEQITG